jgi:hypothetical protein
MRFMRLSTTLKPFSLLMTISLFATVGCKTDQKDNASAYEKKEATLESKGWERLMKQEVMKRIDPALGYVPTERIEVARRYRDNQLAAGRIDALGWTERGPSNIGGRTRAVLIDKRDPTGNTIYASGVGGGIWKCTAFKSATPAWTKVNDFMPNLAISAMIQDPVNTNTFYAGTGEGWFNIDALKGIGIFKSTDGGVTWNLLASTSTFEYVQDLAIDNSGNLYASLRNQAGATRGVHRSADGGTSWTQVLGAPLAGFATGRAADLEVASNGDVYATLGIFSSGQIWKSPQDGANTGIAGAWNNITPTFPATTAQRIEVAVAPSNAQRVYAFAQNSTNSQVTAVMRSNDGGLTWTSVAVPSALNNGGASQTWYNLIAAVDPTNPDVLVAAGLNISRSTNGGTTWTTITSSGTVHVDHHVLIYDGAANLISGNDGGIFFSDNANSAGTPLWSNKNSGFNITQYYGVAIHPTTTNYMLAGAQDNGTHRFSNPGINVTTTVLGGDGMLSHIDQTDGQIQIVSNFQNNYRYSNNGGVSFTSASTAADTRFINPSDYDDAGNVLYTADIANQYNAFTNLEGAAAIITNNVASMTGRQVSCVKADPNAAHTIWLGCSTAESAGAGVTPILLKLTSANTNSPTVAVATTLSFLPAGAYVSCVDVEKNFPNNILLTCSNYGVTSVWQSTDGGVNFTAIEGNLPDIPVNFCLYAPRNVQLNGPTGGNGGVLLGTDLGVWTTSNINGAATQWISNNTGLANVSVPWLEYRSSDATVAAATHGRGVFTTTLPLATGVSNITNTKGFISYISNTASSLQIVKGNLPTTRTMQVQVFDMNGRMMISRQGAYQNTDINIGKLAAGSYTLLVLGDRKERFVGQFVK